jgi:hypothetical protein
LAHLILVSRAMALIEEREIIGLALDATGAITDMN